MKNSIKRLPRKLKKQLRKQGVDPKVYLEELQLHQYREKHLDIIFDKDYNDSHKIVQQEVGVINSD